MSERKNQYNLILVLLVTTLLFDSSCKEVTNNESLKDKAASSGNDQKGYLNSDDNSASFIRWTEINNKLNGQLNILYAKGKRGKSTETSSHPFEGMSDGKNISINFTGSKWTDGLGGTTWTGTIAADSITLVIPSKSGTLEPVRFRVSSVEEYNQLVLGIKQGVNRENTKIQKEDAEAARLASEQSAVVATYEQVSNILNNLANNAKSLQENSRYDDIVKAYAKTWDKMQSDYLVMKEKAAKSPLTSTQFYSVQTALYTLQTDTYSMDSNGYSMESRKNSTNDKIKFLEERIAQLQKAWFQFQQAKAANSTGKPEVKMTNEQVSEIINATQDEIKRVKDVMNEAQRQTIAYDKQARDLYKRAELLLKSLKPIEQ